MSGFLRWLTTWSAGDVLSLIGLAIAIWQIHRAKSIAEQVRASVREIRQELTRKLAAVDLNEVIRDLEEIKDMHRSGSTALLPRRYTAIRRKLKSVRSMYARWSPKQRKLLQESIGQFSNFEQLIDSTRTDEAVELKQLNSRVNEQIDRIVELLSVLENEERAKDG